MLNYLDRVEQSLAALPLEPAVKQAAICQEGLRRRPQALQGENPKAATLRGVLLLCAVVLRKAGDERCSWQYMRLLFDDVFGEKN